MVPRPHRVVRRRKELSDTVTLLLEPLDGELAAFTPGQFNMLYAFGIGEAAISISGTPLLHTIRAVGATSRALCTARPGTVIGVRGPFGTGWDVESAEGLDVVVVAGGIGLAPLRPVIHRVLENRDRYGRIAILIGARSPDLLLYEREIQAWRSRFDIRVRVTVDSAGPGWRGNVGLVTQLIPSAPVDPDHAVAFVCGPEVMMRFACRALADAGLPPERIRLSMERNMKCAVEHCGHCQFGPHFVCLDGPVFTYAVAGPLMNIREI
jgi:NAD(P)H-flavin reductase